MVDTELQAIEMTVKILERMHERSRDAERQAQREVDAVLREFDLPARNAILQYAHGRVNRGVALETHDRALERTGKPIN